MAVLPNVAKTVRVAMIHSYGSDTDVVTRFFIRYSGTAPSSAQLDTFCASCVAAWGAFMVTECDPNVSLTEVTAVDLSSPSAAQGVFADTIPGTKSGGTLPASTAVVSSYVFGRRYRGGHARGYWPMGVETDVGGPQTWDGGSIGGFQTAVDGFFGLVIAGGWSGAGTLDHVSVSYYHGFTVVINPSTGRARNVPTLRATPVVDVVTANAVRQRIGTQRRRLGH